MPVILSLAYLPPISWCSAFWNAKEVTIEACEHYQKGTARNRAYIAGPNGIQRLSIPLLKGKHQQTPIREVRIAYHEPWQRQHWRTIKTAYGNAPYFEHYADELRQFYETEYTFLFDYNMALVEYVLVRKMGWEGEIHFSTAFNPTPNPSPFGEGGNMELRFGDSSTLAKNKNDTISQGAHNQSVNEMSPPSPKGAGGRYPQVFQEKHNFLPNLSVLDLLLCCGKHGGEILQHSSQNLP